MELAIFILTSLVAIVAALLVILQRNPIASVMYLVTTFVAQAILFIQLRAAFIAILQVIVYAGAIMVLFLFVIMLLNLRREDFGKDIKLKYKPLAIAFAVVLLIETLVVINASMIPAQPGADLPATFGSVQGVGRELFTTYLYPFELTSVLLIVAILGAVVMAKKKL
ncbi:MAG: NADH-quinone oxidoreductase subunit J [candidate division Zixibacteria bacterium]|nr:NADH-quinone oxidoreductase subunit J [candidate division Zixibacteria bacterium]